MLGERANLSERKNYYEDAGQLSPHMPPSLGSTPRVYGLDIEPNFWTAL